MNQPQLPRHLRRLLCIGGMTLTLLAPSLPTFADTPKPPVRRSVKVVAKSWQSKVMATMAKRLQRNLPQIKGTTLAKKKRNIPSQLWGKVNVVMVAFARSHQKTIKTWHPKAKKLTKSYPGLDYMIVPVMNGFARLFGGLIEGGMRKTYKSRRDQLRTLPLYYGRGKFEKGLKLRSTGKLVVVLTDRKGRVFWQRSGPATASKLRSLRNALNKLYR